MGQIKELMTVKPRTVKQGDSIVDAAKLMKGEDTGVAPIVDGDRLVGVITDRDIAIRGIAAGKGSDGKVREAMTREVKYCFEDEDIAQVSRNMGEIQVRRLPVVNRDKRLVGIVSLADLAREQPDSGKALHEIARPGGQHNQSRAA